MKLNAFITILAINFIFSSLTADLAYAQKGSYSIGVTARVVESLEMVTLRDMSFGPVQPGQQQIVIDPLADSETGKMVAVGIPNSRIRVGFVRERILTSANGNETLTFTYEIAGNNQDDQSSAELLQTDNRNLDLNSEGEYYFWIGGQVDIQDAQPGKYDGDFTIEVEYI